MDTRPNPYILLPNQTAVRDPNPSLCSSRRVSLQKYDVLIVGAGIAGLYAAMNLPESMKVLVVCKDIPWECNTFYAQGGIVTALGESDIPVHVEDTMSAGAYHNDRDAVEIMSKTSIETTADILARGMELD